MGVQNFDLIDHRTGTIIRTELSNGRGGNGGIIDFDNVLWSTGVFLRWSVNTPLSSTPGTPWALPDNSWGVAKDPFGNVWVSYDPSTVVYKYSPTGQLIGAYPHGYSWSQGLAIDANGDVWIATSHCGYSISHLKNDGKFVGSVPVAAHGPTGVAIDRKGRIWASSTTGVVERITRSAVRSAQMVSPRWGKSISPRRISAARSGPIRTSPAQPLPKPANADVGQSLTIPNRTAPPGGPLFGMRRFVMTERSRSIRLLVRTGCTTRLSSSSRPNRRCRPARDGSSLSALISSHQRTGAPVRSFTT